MSMRKRTWIVTVLVALLAIGGGVFFWNLPRLRVAWGWDYRPTARLQVASRQQAIAFKIDENTSTNPEAVYRRLLKSQIAMMHSRQVITTALLQPGLNQLDSIKREDEPVDWLLDHLEVTNPEDTEVLEVALAVGCGASKEDQATLVNAITRAYFDVVVYREMKLRQVRQETLKKLASRYKDLVKTRREELRRLAAKAGGSDKSTLVLQAQFNLERLHELRPIQIKLRLEQVGTEALLERRKKSQDAATDQGRRDIAKIEDQLAALEAKQKFVQSELTQLEQLKVEVTDDTLDLQDLQDELKQYQDMSTKIANELELVNVELQAPPRIAVIEEATPGSTK
jgi:polysaccharide biosynthesis transport protein